jgi:hypothetical protein
MKRKKRSLHYKSHCRFVHGCDHTLHAHQWDGGVEGARSPQVRCDSCTTFNSNDRVVHVYFIILY